MSIATILLTDTFSQWRAKDNLTINAVNALGSSGDILSVAGPSSGQILVYDGTFFTNVTINGDALLNAGGTLTITGGGNGASDGQIYFVGSMRSLF